MPSPEQTAALVHRLTHMTLGNFSLDSPLHPSDNPSIFLAGWLFF
jgi:hypothetical protein